ncbi:MAG: RagB/SusD family nutrient uptake outer membrane protein [Candidatus Pseudobacter hemicellulosilyticus]|uniref:RagB/SusD family nutrient uptake outer membrane protein n=1 Tax=Candidatus Pseudobacter hemicellulosilyticus TaxID=3121375 RepID=A0AAJ6BJ47_9BACT|nr:MAG: RagB/SusD family nutrient uptake outer membrane protein [Pseudobacter sp.]
MKKLIILQLLAGSVLLISCKKDIGSLNGISIDDLLGNASRTQLNSVVTGTEAGMRNNINFYLDATGVIGREMYRFAGSEPRYNSELLGFEENTLNNNTFYITNPWNARYRVVKNCNILIEAATNSTFISEEERKGYLGFAKTIKAYQLLLNLNMTYQNGVRVEVDDPEDPGPLLSYEESLAAIAGLLDAGRTDLTGAAIIFTLAAGFTGFDDAAGLIRFNRALAARVAVYRKLWGEALTALNESFLDLTGPFNTGVYSSFSTGPNDQLNPVFLPQNNKGEIRLAHPSYAQDILPGDDRLAKAPLRTEAASQDGLTSNRDVWVYTSSTAPLTIIRNEELILLYAEANITVNPGLAATTLNRIRGGHNLTPLTGNITEAVLVTDLLYQRRYSLFYEGHRWVDLRRYNHLNELPTDRTEDDVWEQFPVPLTEGGN